MYAFINLILISSVCGSYGVIYQLNDTEYEQLPPLFELEDYDSCLDNSGVYCLTTLELYGTPDNKIYNLIQEYSQHFVKHFNYTKIDRGVCVSRTCKNYIINNGLDIDEDLKSILEGCLNKTLKEKYDLDIKLHTVTCEKHKDDWAPLDTADYAVAAVIVVLCVSVVLGSWFDLHHDANDDDSLRTGQKYLLCFSIIRNTKRLFQVNNTQQTDHWNGFDGIRVITQLFVVFGHIMYHFGGFVNNPHEFEKSYDNKVQRLVYSASSIIQIFFFITGFLMIYYLQIAEEKRKLSWIYLLQCIFARWWRLTPSLAVVIAFMATWVRHIGSGPIWKRQIINGVSSQCRKYYWAHVFYFNNYLSDDYLCSLESWYLAADMQLLVLGLIVHFLIRKQSWRIKLGTLTMLLLIGIVSPIAHVSLQNLDGFVMLKPELYRTLIDETMNNYHKYAYNNTACYTIGMGSGYLAYYLKQKKLEFSNSKVCNFMSWFFIPAFACIFYVGTFFYEDGKHPSIITRVLFASSHRVFIGIVMTFYVLEVVLKFNGFSKHVLEWSGWKIPSRLSYCVFLIHDNILHYLMGSRTHLVNFSMLYVIYVYLGVLLLSQVLAVILHLLVEAPGNQLLKIFMSGNGNKKKIT